jgi:hypothetical protein
MTARKIPNKHPGEVLLEDFIKPMKLSQYRAAPEQTAVSTFRQTSSLMDESLDFHPAACIFAIPWSACKSHRLSKT